MKPIAGALTLAVTLMLAAPAAGQDARGDAALGTLDGLIAELYGVISGPPGERDWDRFHALFVPGAILLNAGPRADSLPAPAPISPAGYQEQAGPFFREHGFFESEIARTTHRYGTVAQLWSTYESRQAAGAEPYARGINSIVAVRHDGRWWITSIVWDAERPGNPIPEAYLPGG
jgi:hypothetical protein